jgi:hypothetical protein
MLRSFGRATGVGDPLRACAGVLFALLLVAGCSSSHGGGTTGPTTGSLAVTITAPAGATPSVKISGPAGYSQTLSATATLSGLAPGSYTVTAAQVTVADSIVASVDTATVTGSPAAVTANATATVTAAYAQRPGSGGLWFSSFTSRLAFLTASQLAAGTPSTPAASIGTNPSNPWGVAFDAKGNLWVVVSAGVVEEFTASQLTSNAPTPAVVLSDTAGSISGSGELAFDANGNLWLGNAADSSVVEFAANQITQSGSPVPVVTLNASTGSLSVPWSLAFDLSGNLWVGNFQNNTVVEFSSAQLAASGSPTPAVTLSGGVFTGPFGVAFDASGNLWVSNVVSGHVDKYTPAMQVTGSPTPAVSLSTGFQSAGMAFDASGNLWVANNGGAVVEYRASQLAATGSPTPAVTLSSGVPWGLAFNPHASGLPLKP